MTLTVDREFPVNLFGRDHWILKLGDARTNAENRDLRVTLSARLPGNAAQKVLVLDKNGEAIILKRAEFQVIFAGTLGDEWAEARPIKISTDSRSNNNLVFKLIFEPNALSLKEPLRIEAVSEPVPP